MSSEAFARIMDNGAEAPAVEPARAQEQEAPVQAATNETRSFTGELGALFREGLKDVQNVVLHAFPDSIRGVEEPGTPLNPTQQMVTNSVLGGPEPVQGQSFSLQDILDAPAPMTPPVQEQGHEQDREM